MLSSETAAAVDIRPAGHADEQAVCATLTMAFASDPAARWVYPRASEYMAYFPRFARAFGGKAFAHGSACMVEGFAGAALWLPPGVEPGEELDALLEETAPGDVRKDVFSLFDQMHGYHPDEPHWYLPLIGIDIPSQGRGYGSALLAHTLAKCDRDRTPAYLESSNARNISLYRRHGFELLGEIQAGSSPRIYPMLRRPFR